MGTQQNILVREIGVRARHDQSRLAAELARAPSVQKEAILAEMDFERWLAECCEQAQYRS